MSDITELPMSGNQLIEASAGTGKTYTITNLCLRLLLGRDVPWQRPLAIHEILILTFTRAATDELKQRIATRIREARETFRRVLAGEQSKDDYVRALVDSSPDTHRDLQLLAAAGQMMDEAGIFTIHGFCARVLDAQAFESGTLFSLEVNAERDHLLKTAAEDVFRQHILSLPPDIRDYAMTVWPNPQMLAEKLRPLLFRGALNFIPPHELMSPEHLIATALEAKRGWQENKSELKELLSNSNLKKNTKPIKRITPMEQFVCEPGADLNNELWEIYSKASLTSRLKEDDELPSHPVLDKIDEVATGTEQLLTNLWHDLHREVSTAMTATKQATSQLTLDDLLTTLAGAVNRDDSLLAEALRKRWPVAMIDEFQDTDDIQNSIFSRVYEPAGEQVMLMIGDPKQAIYNFRGADIYTYINARRQATKISTLGANWRSTPDMVAATNELFNKDGIFGNDKDIPFQAVTAARQKMSFRGKGGAITPYRVLVAEDDGAGRSSLAPLMEHLMAGAAEETVRLLTDDSITIDDKPVTTGQIAFLVRNRSHALAAQQALRARGIQSVYLTLESVFLQDTAEDLKLILEAILEPANERAIRAALGTQLMLCSALDIVRLGQNVEYQQEVLAEFRGYHELWLEQGIAPMLNTLMTKRHLAEKWLRLPEGERQVTNLRHLTEILQQRAAIAPGMYQLLKWFNHEQKQAETVSNEERQLRLESDENLVKIITMHAAKGLEYDIVMIPMPIFTRPRRGSRNPILYHREQGGLFRNLVDLNPGPKGRDRHQKEEFDEEMRLLYVALTRARYHCLIGLPGVPGLPKSAIARLLSLTNLEKTDNLFERTRQALPDEHFEVTAVEPGLTPYQPAVANDLTLVAPNDPPHLDGRWRIHSYTGIVARLSATHELQGISGFADDDTAEALHEPSGQTRNRYTFPRGARVGVVLHSLMERIDFTQTDHKAECLRACRRLGLDEAWLPILSDWLDDILDAPLGATCLRDIKKADRLDEMEFHFPLSAQGRLIEFLQDTGYLQPGRLERLNLEGMMTGKIDLLYRTDDRYFIVDYKSNYLGHARNHYGADQMNEAMTHHQYRLQYLIYTVAIHRMLSRKLDDYDYKRDLGGVYYLFLRGLTPEGGAGVYYDRPDINDVITANKLLSEP